MTYDQIVAELEKAVKKCAHKKSFRRPDGHSEPKPCSHKPKDCKYKRILLLEQRFGKAA